MVKTQNMVKYVIKRILLMIPMLIFVLITTWLLSQLMSTDPVLNKLGAFVDPDIIERERERIGWYDPWYIKLLKYFGNFFTGNWGTSYLVANGVPVLTFIGQIYPKTIELVIIPVVIIPIIAVKMGVISAQHRNKWKDTAIRIFWMFGASIPVFFLAIMLQYNIGTNFNFEIMHPNSITIRYPNPSWPFSTGFRFIDAIIFNDQVLLQDTILHLLLPMFCMTIVSLAGITRQTRADMLEVMEKDYVRTARAKGVKEKDVINKHALRNALIPTSTLIVGGTAARLTGSLFLEIAFNYTGMGYYMIAAITLGDYVVINGLLVITIIIILSGTLMADILYTLIDPRIIYK